MGKVVNIGSEKSTEERLRDFSIAYANNGGDHIKAYIEAGFSENTAKQNAKKYLDKNYQEVMSVVKKEFGLKAAKAGKLLEACIEDEAAPWSAKLKAVEMMLKNSGVQKDTLVIEENDVSELTPEERQEKIAMLQKRLAEG